MVQSVVFHYLGKSRDGQSAAAYSAGEGDVGAAFTANAELRTSSFDLAESICQTSDFCWETELSPSFFRSQLSFNALCFSLTGKLSSLLLCHLCSILILTCDLL